MTDEDSRTAYTVKDLVLRLEVKVDSLLETATRHLAKTTEVANKVDDHERRLRDLEKWRYAIPASVAAGIASVATAVAAVFAN